MRVLLFVLAVGLGTWGAPHIFPDWPGPGNTYFVWAEDEGARELWWAVAPEGETPGKFYPLSLSVFVTPRGIVWGTVLEIRAWDDITFFSWKEDGVYVFTEDVVVYYPFSRGPIVIPLPPGHALWLSMGRDGKDSLVLSYPDEE